ncbi:DUF3857 domain-containing transglutaminase family protein [Candidatus Omnitrophota bacterium]
MKQALLFGERILLAIFICAGVVFAPTLIYAEDEVPVSESAVAEEELSFDERHKDKSAITLLYKKIIDVNDDYSYSEKVHRKYLVLKEGAKSLGEISLSYEKGRERIINLKAHTITPDGRRLRYSKIQDLKSYSGFPMYSDLRTKVITFPEVTIGSVVEYEYTRISKGLPIKDAFWYYDCFDYTWPVKEKILTVSFPKKLGILYKEFNLQYQPKISEDESRTTYSWHLKELGKYEKSEGATPPLRLEFVSEYIEFCSIKSWKDVSDWYYDSAEKNSEISPEIERAAREIFKDKDTVSDKVRALAKYIQDNFRYVSMSFGKHALEPHPVREVFRNKYGDCKDLSILCRAMLKLGGMESYVALFNDEFSITDPQYDLPIPVFFDHVLLLVIDPQEGNFFFDPLLKGYDIGEYYLSYQGAHTFVITEDGGRFERFPEFDEERNSSKAEYDIIIYDDGSSLIETKLTYDLDASIELRQGMKALSDEQREDFDELMSARTAGSGKLLDRRIDGLEDEYGQLVVYSKVKRPEHFQVTEGMIIIDFAGLARPGLFDPKERKKPIFWPENMFVQTKAVYHVPEGFRVSHMPKSFHVREGFLEVERKFIREGNAITVIQDNRTKRMEIPKEEYAKLKKYFKNITQRTNQRIILKERKPILGEIKDFFSGLKKD